MKIKISSEGCLYLDRGVGWKHQYCPVQQGNECGEWCPLFGESTKVTLDVVKNKDINTMMLSLCKKTLNCKPEDFIDERKKE